MTGGPSAESQHQVRVLVIANALAFPPYPDEIPALLESTEGPRAWINEVDADLHFLDQRLLTDPPGWRRSLYRRLPIWVVQVLEAYRVGRRYDVVFCWSTANVTLALGLLLRLTRRRLPVVALLTRVSEPKKAWLLQRVHPSLNRIILPPVAQRQFAIERLGVPADKFVDLPWTLDTDFWRSPDPQPTQDTVSAAGGEMRDYPTLVRAMDGLPIPCHIAGVLQNRADWLLAPTTHRDDRETPELPTNVTFGTLSAVELRALYARSRFVVVPLQPTTSDNGITCMHEAWSMGRGVIVSAVAGQRDAFTQGVEGVWVPQGDAEALRDAIVALWNDPARTAAMGAAGRDRVVSSRDHQVFSDGITRLFSDVARGAGAGRRADARRGRTGSGRPGRTSRARVRSSSTGYGSTR